MSRDVKCIAMTSSLVFSSSLPSTWYWTTLKVNTLYGNKKVIRPEPRENCGVADCSNPFCCLLTFFSTTRFFVPSVQGFLAEQGDVRGLVQNPPEQAPATTTQLLPLPLPKNAFSLFLSPSFYFSPLSPLLIPLAAKTSGLAGCRRSGSQGCRVGEPSRPAVPHPRPLERTS